MRAPAAGTVNALMTAPGAPVDGTTPIASITNLNRLAVRVDLSEFDVARVKPGLEGERERRRARRQGVPGRGASSRRSTGTDKDGVVTFPVTVSLKGVQGPRPGMNVSVRIIVAQANDVVQVPIDAVSHDDEDNATVAGHRLGRQGRRRAR